MKKKVDNDVTCEVTFIDKKKVKNVKKSITQDEEIFNLSATFKVLGDSTRLKIVLALAVEELCVCDLSALLGVSVSAASHQLQMLRDLKIVKYRKSGKMVYYSLSDHHINSIISDARIHLNE